MRGITLPLVVALMLSGPAAAQTRNSNNKAPSPAARKLVSVKATGTSRYTDQEILAASGLQLGQDAADADFKEAAKRLGDSGLFREVVYSFSYSGSEIKLDLQLTETEASKLVPANFDNFVWFSDAELLASVQRRVPLFKNLVPVEGRLSDLVSQALQGLLREKGLPGRVDFLRQGGMGGGDLTGIVYRVLDVSMRIRNLEFPGASPEQSAFLTAGVRKLHGVEYSRSALAAVAKFDLSPLFRQRGYLKAAFGASDAKVISQSPEPEGPAADEIEVNAILPVVPGKQYSVSGVAWKGNSAITTDEASPLFHLATDRPADAVRMEEDEKSLTKLYHSRGYMTVKIQPEASFDEEKSAVHYDMNISEGDLYRMGDLEILGSDSSSKDRLREAWTLREGQPYNADYARKFLQDAVRLLPKGYQDSMKLNIDEVLDSKSKTVDVTIHLKTQ